MSEVRKQISLAPAWVVLLAWLAFSVATVGWIFAASLSTTREIFTYKLLNSGLHFENFRSVLLKYNFARYFYNSLIYATVSGVGTILIAAPAAYVIGRFDFPGRKFLTNNFLVAMSVPIIMLIIPLYGFMVRLKMIGSLGTLIIMYIVTSVPFTTYFLIGFFSSLPQDLEDAAFMDGCSQYRAFWQIMFPLASPGVITVGIFNFITVWNEYFMALIFANTTETRTLALGLWHTVQSMRYVGDWAGLFAAVVIVFLPTFIIYLLLSRKIIAGITGGAVKS
jgi:N-acetylglucosamine transport system permease protein